MSRISEGNLQQNYPGNDTQAIHAVFYLWLLDFILPGYQERNVPRGRIQMRPAKKNTPMLPALLLVCLLTLIYWPALTGQFVNHDDPLYITENPVILQGVSWYSLKWSFTSISVGHWHPVTWLSHLAGIELFGSNPFGHHLINLLLHASNALLLAFLLHRMTGKFWRSWLVASLFAVHPLNVEAVAWIAERKGVLEAFFWLLAVLSYLRYASVPVLSRYLPVLFFFLLALFSKATAVTMPFVLLLLDFWPLDRCRVAPHADTGAKKVVPYRLVIEKLPFLLLSMISGAAAIYAMGHAGAISSYALSLRLQNVILGYSGYILKLFHPVNLSVIYPFVTRPSGWGAIASLAGLLAVTALVVLKRKRIPYLFSGWFWYLMTVAPVIGFINLGQQTMPDRYAYIPLIGLLIMMVWGAGDLLERFRVPVSVRTMAACAAIAMLGFLSNRQAAFWHDSESLFSHAIEINPFNSLAHNNLGNALLDKEELNAAFREFNEAVRIDPNNSDAWNNLGVTYGKVGRNGEAIEAYLQAQTINPAHALAHLNLGMAYIGLNDMPKALKEYRILQNLKPEFAEKMKRFLN